MSTGIERLLVYISCLIGISGITLEPTPIATCTVHNSLVLNCSFIDTWESVGFNLVGDANENIAFFGNTGSACRDMAEPTPGLYQTSCDYNSKQFYLTINNVTATYNRKKIECLLQPAGLKVETTINVQYAPSSSPSITQLPTEYVIEGNKVILTCAISGANPLATISWNCTGFTDVVKTTTQTTTETVSRIERVVTKDDNDKTCICTAKHLLWVSNKEVRHTLDVYFKPKTQPLIIQTPTGPVNESENINLYCEIQGGNPRAIITWQCNGSQTVITTGSPVTNISVSNVQLTVGRDRNGDVCICKGSHPAWNQDKVASVTFDVRYPPTSSPTITQIPIGHATEGDNVSLTCKIFGGNPLPIIVFQCAGFTTVTKNGIPSTDQVVSIIERVVTEDDNDKQCVCRGNHYLWANTTEEIHILDVYFKPTTNPFIKQTPPNPVNEDDQINLNCEIQGGHPLAEIKWQCEGSQPVTSTGSPTFDKSVSTVQLTASQDRNGDICTCNGSHPTWKHNKVATVTFDVIYAPSTYPSITSIPDGPVIEGNKVTLSCGISGGNPLAKIVWQCSGFTPVTLTTTLSKDQVVSSIEGVVTKNDNSKECICTGSHLLWRDEKKAKYNFTVYYSTIVQIRNILPIKLVQNKSISLVCQEMDGNPKNASFEWYKDNVIIGKTANYSITEAKANDTGNYTCQGSNGIGFDNANAEVYILYSPFVSTLSAPYGNTIEENGTTLFLCTVESYPPPNITWRKHGSNLTLQSNEHKFQGYFTIENATCFHTGNYTCMATNIINGEEYIGMKDIELFVTCSPRLYNINEDTTNIIGLAVGQTLSLSKHILAYPKGNVTWLLKQNTSENSIQSAVGCSKNNIFEHQICFIRFNLTETDFGMYSAVTVNDIGTKTFAFTVKPQGPPYKSTNVNVTCGVLKADISWMTGFNGGQEQTFYIKISDTNGLVRFHETGIIGKEKGKIKRHSLKISTGLFEFDIFGNNTFGSTTVKGVPCEVKGLNKNESLVDLAAGLGSGLAVLVTIIVAAIFVFRKRIINAKGDDTKLFKRSVKRIQEEDDDELKDNPLYVTSDAISDGENGPVYSVVDKTQKTGSAQPANFKVINKGPLYPEVKTNDNTGKKDHVTKKKSKTTKKDNHSKHIEMENVYGNSLQQDNIGDSVYANSECKPDGLKTSLEMNRPKKNKDGLIYADLDLDPNSSGTKYVIRGLENKTNYAIIDLSVKVDPLPSDDDDDSGEDGDKKND